MAEINLLEVLYKLVLAVLLGGIIGWERETLDRPAGFRTHVLVCVGSTVYMLVSISMVEFAAPGRTADPGRIAAQVASGMGFLGAGTIIRHGSVVRGLTTAASLWTVAAIGLCVARGGMLLWVAALATVVVFSSLTSLSRIEKMKFAKRQYRMLVVRCPNAKAGLPRLLTLLGEIGIQVNAAEIAAMLVEGQDEIRLTLRIPAGISIDDLTPRVLGLEGVSAVQWE